MLISPIIFIVLVLSVFGLALVILFVITSYNHLIKKIADTQAEKATVHEEINERAESLLNEARERHLQIINEANKKATEIINQTTSFKTASNEATQAKLDSLMNIQKEALEKISRDLQNSYSLTLKNLEQKDIETFTRATKIVETNVDREMQDFTSTIKNETIEAHKIIQSRLEEEYAKAEQEIATYKTEQLKKIDAAAYPLLKNVTSILLGRALSTTDQQDLVLQALEQAKKEVANTKN